MASEIQVMEQRRAQISPDRLSRTSGRDRSIGSNSSYHNTF